LYNARKKKKCPHKKIEIGLNVQKKQKKRERDEYDNKHNI
jgi:hypothetical protein